MELRVNPAENFSTSPFTVSITYNETVENLLVMISLTVTSVPINKFQISFNGRILKNKGARLDALGIKHGDAINLETSSNNYDNLQLMVII